MRSYVSLIVPNRFIFRQVYFGDLPTFLADGQLRAKNFQPLQACHQTSYQDIVDRRGSHHFAMPGGRVVNDYVPFYFSPLTSFTYTIFKRNVPLVSPTGESLGQACEDDRIFLVACPANFLASGLPFCFSNYALNSNAPIPVLETDLSLLEHHVYWDVFDESLDKAQIPEIGYGGVCRWFHDMASPPNRMTRKAKRMAEFLVQDTVPLTHIECIIAKSDAMRDKLKSMMDASVWDIPIYVNRGCYFQ